MIWFIAWYMLPATAMALDAKDARPDRPNYVPVLVGLVWPVILALSLVVAIKKGLQTR